MTGRNDEAEFRELFAQEAAARLARLGEQLLMLEESGNDPELVSSIFREAHTLKGAAAVVGIDDAGRVAHALEDLLEGVRSGERLASAELVAVALAAVDGLTETVPRLVAGEDCHDAATVLEQQLARWCNGESEGAGAVAVAVRVDEAPPPPAAAAPPPQTPAPQTPAPPDVPGPTMAPGAPHPRRGEGERIVCRSVASTKGSARG